MAILLSKNNTQCDDRARPRGATTARRSVGLGLVEILSWMRHCFWVTPTEFASSYKMRYTQDFIGEITIGQIYFVGIVAVWTCIHIFHLSTIKFKKST